MEEVLSLKRKKTQKEREEPESRGRGTPSPPSPHPHPTPALFSPRCTQQGPPASHSLGRAGQSSGLQDPSAVLRDSLKQMKRDRKGGLLPESSPCTFWNHLLSLGTPPRSLRGSLNPEEPPCHRRGLFNLTVATSPRGHIFLPRGDAKAILGAETQGKPHEAHHPQLLETTLLVLDHLFYPCLTPSLPGAQTSRSGRNYLGDLGLWKPWNKASLLCPQRGAEPVH